MLIEELLHAHVEHPARKKKILEASPPRFPPRLKKTADTVIAVAIPHLHICGMSPIVLSCSAEVFFPRAFHVFPPAHLGEIELVRPVHQIMNALKLIFDVEVDGHDDFTTAEKRSSVRCGRMFGLL